MDLEASSPNPTDYSEHAIVIAWRKLSYYWSTVLLIFATFCVIWGIAKEWNNPPWGVGETHPVVEVIIFVAMMFWIAMLEGCQISIVGLAGIDMEPYKLSHPRAYKSCKLVHKGPNVERFLVGRQFLLLFNGFLATKVSGASTDYFYIGDWEWSRSATNFLWVNNALLMVVIIALCQLPTQLVAADKMLGFFELPFGHYYIVVLPCLFVEAIGLTHSSYVLKDVLRALAGIDPSEADPAKEMTKDFLYYIRCFISIAAVIFSGTFIIKGLALSQTGATDGPGWENLPGWAAIVVGIVFLFTMACAEGLQVSAIACAKMNTSSFKARAPKAYRTCQILYSGRNMQAFLVGRQFMVAMMMVLLARVTGYAGSDGELAEGTDWGMGRSFNEGLLQTGFLGAILVVNVAQLASQVTASIFPIQFINNSLLTWLLQLMLLIEASGIVNACWPLAWALDALFKIEKDPFDLDETVNTPAQNILDRKKSMGIPTTKGVSPYDLNQPEREFHLEYTYKVSYI